MIADVVMIDAFRCRPEALCAPARHHLHERRHDRSTRPPRIFSRFFPGRRAFGCSAGQRSHRNIHRGRLAAAGEHPDLVVTGRREHQRADHHLAVTGEDLDAVTVDDDPQRCNLPSVSGTAAAAPPENAPEKPVLPEVVRSTCRMPVSLTYWIRVPRWPVALPSTVTPDTAAVAGNQGRPVISRLVPLACCPACGYRW